MWGGEKVSGSSQAGDTQVSPSPPSLEMGNIPLEAGKGKATSLGADHIIFLCVLSVMENMTFYTVPPRCVYGMMRQQYSNSYHFLKSGSDYSG